MDNLGFSVLNTDVLHLTDLKFMAGKKFTMNSSTPFTDVFDKKVPVLDFVVARSLIETGKCTTVEFILSKEINSMVFDTVWVSRSVILYAFNFLVRNKVYFEDTDKLPAFCEKVFKIPDVKIYRRLVTLNDLTKISHDWIRLLDWSKFNEAVKMRLGMGIAGYRVMKIFKEYECMEGIKVELREVFQIVKDKAKEGIKLEYHPYWNTNKTLNLTKNLNQLMLEVFNPEDLSNAKKSGLIFEIPIPDDTINSYKYWTVETLNYLKTPLKDLLYPIKESKKEDTDEKSG
jgi:hypothetical protein